MPTSRSGRPIIGITTGDAAGIGPEVVAKALEQLGLAPLEPKQKGARKALTGLAYFLVISDARTFKGVVNRVGALLDFTTTNNPGDVDFKAHPIACLDMKNLAPWEFEYGKLSDRCAKAAVDYIKEAVRLARLGTVDAIVTAPINKEALKLAGFDWPGHTELLAHLTDTKDYAMMLVGGPLRVVLVTTHLSLEKVGEAITRTKIFQTIELTYRALKEHFGLPSPRIGVAALNPHGGEGGIFGDEEKLKISPAIDDAKKKGIDVNGPVAPDILFHQAYKGTYDAVVCMYHDQGLIPLKMIAFEEGVNLTLGLPIIRTSPDHGTAFDIVKKRTANPQSMIKAIELAVELVKRSL